MEGSTGIMDTVANVLSTLGQMVTSVVDWLGDVLTFITTNPVVIVPALMFFVVGGCIGLIKRVMRG